MSDLVATMAESTAPVPVAQGPKPKGLVDLIDDQRGQFRRALGVAGMDADRYARSLLTEVRRTPKLLECDPYSVLGAAMTAAQLALEPGPLGHCYLIPRWNSRRGVHECTFQLGYRGMIDLALRSGRTRSIDAHVVYEGDEFEFAYGTEPFLRHRPNLRREADAPIEAIYAVALLEAGGAPFVVLSEAEVEARRGRSNAPDSPAWRSDWDAMARKTGVRALSPYIPQTAEFALANRLDEQVRTDFAATLDELEPPAFDDAPVPAGAVDPAAGDALPAAPEGEPVDPGFGDLPDAVAAASDTAEEPGSPPIEEPVDVGFAAAVEKPVEAWPVAALKDEVRRWNAEHPDHVYPLGGGRGEERPSRDDLVAMVQEIRTAEALTAATVEVDE